MTSFPFRATIRPLTVALCLGAFVAACGGSTDDDADARDTSGTTGDGITPPDTSCTSGPCTLDGWAGDAPITDDTVTTDVAGPPADIGALEPVPPTVTETSPVDAAVAVPLNTNVSVTFSEPMDAATVTTETFSLKQGPTTVPATLEFAGTVATLDPLENLAPSTTYVVIVSTSVTDESGAALAAEATWTFVTGTEIAKGPAPVNLGTAGLFAILSKSGVDTIPTSAITGNVGVSPIDSTAVTGFSLTMEATNEASTSSQIVGRVFAPDYAQPTPANLTTAVSNMEAAFTDAAGRATPDFTELGAGDISGLTLVPGLYKWGTNLLMTTNVTLAGGPDDVWILQVSGGITVAPAVKVVLAGGALPKNIFWQTYGAFSLGTTSHFEGVVLSETEITLDTGASINGRLLSQTAVTLSGSTVTEPDP
jgi:hypothetical protein